MKYHPLRMFRAGVAALLAVTALFACLPSAGALSLSSMSFSLNGSTSVNLTPTSSSGNLVADGVYYLALHDDQSLGLNVIFASTEADKATVGVDPLNGESNETFRLVNRGGGYVSLHPLHAEHLALNALLGAACEKGSLLTLHQYEDGDDASLFYPTKQSDGSYVLRSKACGYVIDVVDGSYVTGNKAILWDANSYARAQSFFLTPAGGSGSASSDLRQKVTSSTLSNGYYVFGAYGDPNMVANVTFASVQEDRAACGLSPWDAESNEIWYVERVGSGNYVTIAPSYCKSLVLNCLLGSAAKAGQGVTLHRKQAGDTASWWLPIRNSDNSYTFVNAASGLALDLANGDCGTVGNGILVYTRNNFLAAQGWQVYKVSDPHAAQRAPEYLNISSGGSGGGSSASTAESAILARLNAMMDGSYGSGAYKVNTTYTGAYASEQCKGFAKKVHMILFGYNIGSTKSKPNNYQISISSSKTRLVGSLTSLSSRSDAALRDLLTQARPGDFLQVRRSHGGSHSMIVLSTSSNAITVYECNVDGRNGIRTATYSWSSFRSSNAAVSLYTAKNYSLH